MSSNSPTLTVLLSDCGQPSGPHIGNDSLLRPYIRPAMRKQAAMAFPPTKGTSWKKGAAVQRARYAEQ